MKLFHLSYQDGAGFASYYFLQRANAEIVYERLARHFKEIQADATTAVNYELLDTLIIEEIETQDAEVMESVKQ